MMGVSEVSSAEPIVGPEPAIIFAYCKLLWVQGVKEEAFTRLQALRDACMQSSFGTHIDVAATNGQAQQSWMDLNASGPRDLTAELKRTEELRKLISK